MSDPIDELLARREGTHGDFGDFACITQSIKAILHEHPNWNLLSFAQKEGAEMIANKLGRVVAGDPNFPDHWDDISGYGRLVSQRLTPSTRPATVNPNFSLRAGPQPGFRDDEITDAATAAMAARLAPTHA